MGEQTNALNFQIQEVQVMYERFTDRARKVMQLANQKALSLRHEYIATEHVLLGLIAEGSGVAANVLKNLNIDFGKVRREVEKIVRQGPDLEDRLTSRLPQTPWTKKVIEYAIEEARSLNHNYVGTEHLLLGLLRETEGVAADVLINLGLNLEAVRAEVRNLLGLNFEAEPRPDVFQIATSLNPEKVETYPVSDSPPLPVTREHLDSIHGLIERLKVRKEEYVMEGDFEPAALCRAEVEALQRLLAWYAWSGQQ